MTPRAEAVRTGRRFLGRAGKPQLYADRASRTAGTEQQEAQTAGPNPDHQKTVPLTKR